MRYQQHAVLMCHWHPACILLRQESSLRRDRGHGRNFDLVVWCSPSREAEDPLKRRSEMTTSIYREVVNRLAVDASFRTRLAADTEGALRGVRVSVERRRARSAVGEDDE